MQELANGEYYHVYNRGTDKRTIFQDELDFQRFWESILKFNVKDPIGSIYESRFNKLGNRTSKKTNNEKLVEFVCYCINPNHYHFLLRQVSDNGISEFIKRLSGGYTRYFNEKYKRSGVLFQGKFKAIHVDTDAYILHLSAYINLNYAVHKLGRPVTKFIKSSWDEFIGNDIENNCVKDIVLDQFNSTKEYKKFAMDSLKEIKRRKAELKEIEFGNL